jgi:hypothetical protein
MVLAVAGEAGPVIRAVPYLVAAGIYSLFHILLLWLGTTPMSAGDLAGPDSYMRLVRVTQLYETGAWFDGFMVRSNAPYGHGMHWTRPFDAILLMGAWLASPVWGFEIALFRWGSLSSPIFHVALGLAAVWATAPIFDVWRRCLVALVLLTELVVLAYAFAGRADHHMLILLVFVLSLGALFRLLQHPFSVGRALASGALVGFGLWLSLEFQLMLATVFATLSVLWVLRGGDLARKGLWLALGLLAAITVALLIERGPGDILSVEYDRISLVQITVAALALSFWAAADRLDRRHPGTTGISRRAIIAALGAAAAAGALYLVHPGLFQGVHGAIDPQLDPIHLNIVAETQPLLPVDAESFGRFAIYLGAALPCVPFLIYLLYRDTGRPAWDSWVCLAVGLVVCLPFALLMARFALFSQILLAIVLVELLASLLAQIERISLLVLRVPLWSIALAVFLFGGIALGPLVMQKRAWQPAGTCDLKALATYLSQPEGLGDRPRLLLTEVDYGAELLYRTDHAVVGTPYHRNVQGLLDNQRLFNQPFDQADRALFERRGIDLILQCRAHDRRYAYADNDRSFYDGLAAGRHPDWLRPVGLPEELDRQFRLYEVPRQ